MKLDPRLYLFGGGRDKLTENYAGYSNQSEGISYRFQRTSIFNFLKFAELTDIQFRSSS